MECDIRQHTYSAGMVEFNDAQQMKILSSKQSVNPKQ